ncbi:hypothetical protein [Humibacter sp.]|uniref:hypothetical protein n=1 Tax=Humibacter sp. TaxID=1940291 RepID=UPI003F7CF3E9
MIPTRERQLVHAATGWQGKITGTNVAVSGTLARTDLDGNTGSVSATQPLAGAGSLGPGTYYYAIPTAGCSALDVTLRASTVTGTHTITLYATLSDNITIKGTATSVTALTANTQATTSVTTLRGERIWILKIVVNAASALVFDQADASAL